MANVLNKITKRFIASANTPDYPTTDWIIDPDMSVINNVPQKYWKIVGDTVVEMNQQEKEAVDAAAVVPIPFFGTQLAMFSDDKITSDQYLAIGTITSSAAGFLFPVNGKVKHISTQWSSATDNFNINLRKNGSANNISTTLVVAGSQKAIMPNMDIPLLAGESLQVYISGLQHKGNIIDLTVAVWFELSSN